MVVMSNKVRVTKRGRLSVAELAKGFFLAVITSGLVALQQSIDKGEINYKAILMAAAGGGVAYLLYNLTQKPRVIVKASNNKEAEKISNNIKNQ